MSWCTSLAVGTKPVLGFYTLIAAAHSPTPEEPPELVVAKSPPREPRLPVREPDAGHGLRSPRPTTSLLLLLALATGALLGVTHAR